MNKTFLAIIKERYTLDSDAVAVRFAIKGVATEKQEQGKQEPLLFTRRGVSVTIQK